MTALVARVTPDGSWVEIAKQKEIVNSELEMRAYFYEKVGFIISSVSGIAETGAPTIAPADISNFELGTTICDHLLRYAPRSPDNMRSSKPTDWLAYRASGAKSVRNFQEHSWRIRVSTMNTAVLVESSPSLSLHSEIYVGGIATASHETIGTTVRKALNAAMALRKQFVI